MTFLIAAVLYLLRKKMRGVGEARENNIEKAFDWIEILESVCDMV